MYRYCDYCQCSADSFTADELYQVNVVLGYGSGFVEWHIADVILQKTVATVPDLILF